MWSFRVPPAPYRERNYALGPGFCCICGQPVYRFGWHADLWGRGANRNAVWHAACVVAWDLWMAPSDYARCPQAPTATALRPDRRAAMEDRRGRSPDPAVPGMARTPPHAVAITAWVLGRTKPAGHQSRRAFGEMRRGSTVPSHGRGQHRADGRSLIRDPARWPRSRLTRLSTRLNWAALVGGPVCFEDRDQLRESRSRTRSRGGFLMKLTATY
jgi:hypothetical protein